jgi:hypothetical protein
MIARTAIPIIAAISTRGDVDCLGAALGLAAGATFATGVVETFTADGRFTPPTGTGGTTKLLAEADFFTADFFFAGAFLATFLATAFFLAGAFLAVTFLAADFFFAGAFLATFLAAAFFLAGAFLATFFAADFFLTATM